MGTQRRSTSIAFSFLLFFLYEIYSAYHISLGDWIQYFGECSGFSISHLRHDTSRYFCDASDSDHACWNHICYLVSDICIMDSCMNIFRVLRSSEQFFRGTYSFEVCICYFSQCRLVDSMGIQHGGDCVYDFIDDFRTDDGCVFVFAKKSSNIEVEY